MNTSKDIVARYIKTKSKTRKIVSYRSDDCELRIYHQKIASFINDNFTNSLFAKAYIKNRSIFDNAKAHLYNDVFVMMDVKDFFNSINHNTLVERLFSELNKVQDDIITKQECRRIVNDCSVGKRGIPLGLITSPVLSNIYLKEFDGVLYGKLKQMQLPNVIYTRYADDLCVSFKHCADAENICESIIMLTNQILKRYYLRLNQKKTRTYNLLTSNHVKITGINITRNENDYRRLSVGRKLKNDLFWDAIKCFNDSTKNVQEVERLKGMQAFILSVEKNGYESCYSGKMLKIVNQCGYGSLSQLINGLDSASK